VDQQPSFSDIVKLPERLDKYLTNASSAANRILFEARQKTFGEAFLADGYDDLLSLFPVFGDIIGEGPRLLDATSKSDKLAGTVRAANAAVGAIPVFGFFLDLAFPASGIITYISYDSCKSKGGNNKDCLFPEGTVERDIMEIQKWH
jgi:hypothetical protein